MRRFSEASKAKLATCHRELQTLFNHIILERDCTIVCGFRGEKDQNDAFNAGNSKLQWPNSKHNTSPAIAVDVVPYENNSLDYGKLQSAEFAGYVKGVADQLYRIGTMTHRIRTGADWNCDYNVDDTKFWDAGHFELIP